MRRRARVIWRWWPVAYLGLCAYVIAGTWQDHLPHSAKINFTVVTGGLALWFLGWRTEQRGRIRAEQLAERARQQGIEPCAVCQHYACDGVECISCGGPCIPPRLTGPVDHASFWLN